MEQQSRARERRNRTGQESRGIEQSKRAESCSDRGQLLELRSEHLLEETVLDRRVGVDDP